MNELYNIVKNRFNYDEKTGWLIWKNCHYKNKNGTRAGGLIKSTGYRTITIDKNNYYEHRIIWLWCNEYDTENQIDHINRIKDDNRICNLREATPSCNMKNIGLKCNNTTGIIGVYQLKNGNFSIEINNNNKKINLGTYNTLLEAAKARYKAEVEYNYENCNSTSTALKYIKDNDPEWLNGDMQVNKSNSNKTSGIKGVSFNIRENKWKVYIFINKKRINLGRFIKLDDAVMARYEAEILYNQTENSQAFNYLKERNLI